MEEEINTQHKVHQASPRTARTGPNAFHDRAWQRLKRHGHRGGQHAASNGSSTRDIPPLPMRHEQLLRAMDEGAVPSRPTDLTDHDSILAEFEAARRRYMNEPEVSPKPIASQNAPPNNKSPATVADFESPTEPNPC